MVDGKGNMSAGTAAAVAVDAVSKSYGRTRALESVTFGVRPGEIAALLGENGAGKSTLVGILSGVGRPDGGRIEVAGAEVSFANATEARRAGVATVFQEPALAPHQTVAENLFLGRMGPAWRLCSPGRRERRAAELLRGLEWDIDPRVPAQALSPANQQLVEVARAVHADAKVLLLDEPTSSIGPAEVEQLHQKMRELAATGVAVIYVSHRLSEVFDVAQSFIVLRDGKVALRAGVDEVDRETVVKAMLGKAVVTGSKAEAAPAATNGAPVFELRGVTRAPEFENVDLVCRAGEVLGLTGLRASGAAELTTAMFDRQGVEGEITFLGRGGHRSPRQLMREGVAYVPPDRAEGMFPNLSLAENIALTARIARVPAKTTVAAVIERLSIRAADAHVPVRTLSGGNQQKAMIGRWLLLEPKAFLLVEPTRGVDLGVRREIHELLWEFAKDGMAVVVSSTDFEEISELSDRILVMHEGVLHGELTVTTPDTISDSITEAATA